MDDKSWATLVDSIVNGMCTPFLGAGVAMPHLPSGAALAKELAEKYDYPFPDFWNLPRVAQHIALEYEPFFARNRVIDRLKFYQNSYLREYQNVPPDNYLALAELHLPLYVTTNYDDFLDRGITQLNGKSPKVEICRWNNDLWGQLKSYPSFEPTADNPLVFHLHGRMDHPSSLLLTEDDYIDFTVNLAIRTVEESPIWHPVRAALTGNSLLFVGYSLEDWNFRVMMKYLASLLHLAPRIMGGFSIQLSPNIEPDRLRGAEQFLEKYFEGLSRIKVHWMTATEFLGQLRTQVRAARVEAAAGL